jgi:antirestriction protein
MDTKKVFKKNPNFVARKIEDEIILVPITKDAADFEAIFNLRDAVAVRIWELMDGKRSVDSIKEKLVNEFTVTPEKLEKDLKEFMGDLKKVGAIEESSSK